jgi:hypothetical protein
MQLTVVEGSCRRQRRHGELQFNKEQNEEEEDDDDDEEVEEGGFMFLVFP